MIAKSLTGNQTDTTLVEKNKGSSISISRVLLVNTHTSNELLVERLYVDTGSAEFNLLFKVKIPVGASLLLDDEIDYIKSNNYSLKITTTGSANCDIIIKI